MLKRKYMIIGFLAFCLTATLFLSVTISGDNGTSLPYDPWYDLNDDGRISITDIVLVALRFGTTGTPINKTALLLEVNATFTKLLSKIDSLNASLVKLQSALEANYSVTSLKLAPYAIPFNSTYSTSEAGTTETINWGDMPDTSLTITLNRTSHLLIIFSANAYVTDAQQMLLRTRVNEVSALPGAIYFTPSMTEALAHKHRLTYMAYTYHFYQPSVDAGAYIIQIQWKVTGGTGYVSNRTLTVIGLPA